MKLDVCVKCGEKVRRVGGVGGVKLLCMNPQCRFDTQVYVPVEGGILDPIAKLAPGHWRSLYDRERIEEAEIEALHAQRQAKKRVKPLKKTVSPEAISIAPEARYRAARESASSSLEPPPAASGRLKEWAPPREIRVVMLGDRFRILTAGNADYSEAAGVWIRPGVFKLRLPGPMPANIGCIVQPRMPGVAASIASAEHEIDVYLHSVEQGKPVTGSFDLLFFKR